MKSILTSFVSVLLWANVGFAETSKTTTVTRSLVVKRVFDGGSMSC